METIFILLMFINAGHAGGGFTAEFANKKSCEYALLQAQKNTLGYLNSKKGICVPKNVELLEATNSEAQ